MTKPKEKITLEGGREVIRFIRHPAQVRDGTVRCIACGQIDDEPYHDMAICQAERARAWDAYANQRKSAARG